MSAVQSRNFLAHFDHALEYALNTIQEISIRHSYHKAGIS